MSAYDSRTCGRCKHIEIVHRSVTRSYASHACVSCGFVTVDSNTAEALLTRLIDLDEKTPSTHPEARAIIEAARILLRRYRTDPPEIPHV